MDKMEAKDWVTGGLAATALVWGIIAFFWNRSGNIKSRAIADTANTIATQTSMRVTAETEIALLRLINQARMAVMDIFVKINDIRDGRRDDQLSADQKRLIGSLEHAYDVAVETLLNSYELGCGMYLDEGKLDKDRFKRQYS